MVTMLGWFNPDAAWASWMKRRRLSGSPELAPESTLMATMRLSLVSWALKISPMPPAPSRSRIWYCRIVCPIIPVALLFLVCHTLHDSFSHRAVWAIAHRFCRLLADDAGGCIFQYYNGSVPGPAIGRIGVVVDQPGALVMREKSRSGIGVVGGE